MDKHFTKRFYGDAGKKIKKRSKKQNKKKTLTRAVSSVGKDNSF